MIVNQESVTTSKLTVHHVCVQMYRSSHQHAVIKMKEIEDARCAIIIKGMPFHVNRKGRKETDVQTKQVCFCLLQELGLYQYVQIKAKS